MTLFSPSKANYRCGFVGILGVPNVGKSTCLNALIGQKISIVSNKPQTTRSQIRGILTSEEFQAIFIDTPGINDPSNLWHQKNKVETPFKSIQGADLVLFFTEAKKTFVEFSDAEKKILQELQNCRKPIALVINKIDRIDSISLIRQIEKSQGAEPFCEVFPVSALKRKNLQSMVKAIPKYLPVSSPYYKESEITDQTVRMIALELIREQCFKKTSAEIPYECRFEMNLFREELRKITIDVTIFVKRESQKIILLGAKGSKIKLVGTEARQAIEGMTGKKVFLNLNIKTAVKKK